MKATEVLKSMVTKISLKDWNDIRNKLKVSIRTITSILKNLVKKI